MRDRAGMGSSRREAGALTAARTKREPTGTRLLEIATDHVRRHGLAQTTVVAVAREAKVSHAAVYRYYASRDALVDAVTAEWLKQIEGQLAGVADSPDPADDKLERMMLLLARLYRERLDGEPNLYEAWLAAAREVRPVVRRHRSKLRQLLERTIEEGRTTQLFQSRSSERLILFLTDALYRFTDPNAIAADRSLDRKGLERRMSRVLSATIRAMAVRVV
jgi:AcrR family transcriptional regulator